MENVASGAIMVHEDVWMLARDAGHAASGVN